MSRRANILTTDLLIGIHSLETLVYLEILGILFFGVEDLSKASKFSRKQTFLDRAFDSLEVRLERICERARGRPRYLEGYEGVIWLELIVCFFKFWTCYLSFLAGYSAFLGPN